MRGALAGGLIGAAFFLSVFGVDIVRPGNLGWLMRHDTQTYVLAFHHFRREPWQWPPGAIVGVGHPVGSSIGNADAMPLVAFPLKVAHAFLPDPFQFLGLWLLGCYALQGAFGALLVRQATRDVVLQALGAALFVLTPALLQRNGHTALCAHWTFLAAIWLVIGHARLTRRSRRAGWLALSAITAATQPYLTVVVLGLALCVVANDVLADDAPLAATRRGALEAVAIVGVVAVVFWLSGYFLVTSSDMVQEGLGFYSMNLLGPLMSNGYSSVLPSIPMATPGQYEGMVYFGAGWLALGALALGLRLTHGPVLPRLAVVWLGVAAFTLLAVSPVVTAGPWVLADLSAWSPPGLAVFRSSGRFGWLAMYLAFAGIVWVVTTRVSRAAAIVALTVAVTLQIWDLSDALAGLRARRSDATWTTWDDPLKSPVWGVATAAHRHVVMVPPDMCAALWPAPAGPHLPFSLLAGRYGATINSGNAGRYDTGAVLGYCATLQASIRAGRLDDDSLYVLSPAMRDALATAVTTAPPVCGTIDGFAVCATETGHARWRDLARAAGFAAAPLR